MASALTIFNGNIIADVEVSSKQSESHAFRAVATEFPIQSGSIVSDHVFLKPRELDVSFTSSNTPGPGYTAQQVFNAFKRHFTNRDLLKIITEHDTYENMIIVDFQPVHKSPHKGALECTLKFQQINSVSIVAVPYLKAIDTSAQPTTNRGLISPLKMTDASLQALFPPPAKK